MLPKKLRHADAIKKCRQFIKKPMTDLEIKYHLTRVDQRGELIHPSGLSFKKWKSNLKIKNIMERVIWKFKLDAKVEMPIGAEVLTVQVQEEDSYLWALVNPKAEKEMREFTTFGTGYIVKPRRMKYIGTYQLIRGAFIFYVFEILKKD